MRKKTITKIVAGACVVAMAVSFAACGKKTVTDESSTDPSASDVSEATSAPETTVAPETTTVAGGQGATTAVAPTSNKPTDTASAVKFYNDGVAKIGGVTATVTRSLVEDNCVLKILGIPTPLTKLVPEAPKAFALTDANLEGAALKTLDPSNIANTSVAESGDNYVITFTLTDANFDISSTPGTGGYMYFLDVATINETIVNIGKSLAGENFVLGVKTEEVKLALHSSSFVITMSKAGNILSADLSFTEDVTAPISKPISASAAVQGKGTVKYTVA